jgi:hypothetical protein
MLPDLSVMSMPPVADGAWHHQLRLHDFDGFGCGVRIHQHRAIDTLGVMIRNPPIPSKSDKKPLGLFVFLEPIHHEQITQRL